MREKGERGGKEMAPRRGSISSGHQCGESVTVKGNRRNVLAITLAVAKAASVARIKCKRAASPEISFVLAACALNGGSWHVLGLPRLTNYCLVAALEDAAYKAHLSSFLGAEGSCGEG